MLDQQLLIGTVFLAGLASFLSPCIFPDFSSYWCSGSSKIRRVGMAKITKIVKAA
jgi:cytochrome c biogenesis protein CcdA